MEPPNPWKPPVPLPSQLATERTRLRYWQPDDAGSMLRALDAGRDSFLPWLPWVTTDNRTPVECIFSIERFRRKREQVEPPCDDFVLGIFDRSTNEALGGTGLHRIDAANHQAEIGYWIRPDRRRQGLCTEAVAGLITWAFTPQADGGWGLRRIEIFCAGSNRASQAVPKKLGLRQEVHQIGRRWVNGWDDTLGWAVLADEWDVMRCRIKPA
jgi:RimJ/RimL family protein N-acetyltransferase